jgi:hypothetical protein
VYLPLKQRGPEAASGSAHGCRPVDEVIWARADRGGTAGNAKPPPGSRRLVRPCPPAAAVGAGPVVGHRRHPGSRVVARPSQECGNVRLALCHQPGASFHPNFKTGVRVVRTRCAAGGDCLGVASGSACEDAALSLTAGRWRGRMPRWGRQCPAPATEALIGQPSTRLSQIAQVGFSLRASFVHDLRRVQCRLPSPHKP